MKDGRTHLAHKAEHAVDLETGAILAVTLQEADQGDTTTIQTTLPEAVEQLRSGGCGHRRQGEDGQRKWSPTRAITVSKPCSICRTPGTAHLHQ